MTQSTDNEREEWIKDAMEAIKGRKLLRICSLHEAYAALSGERVWRDELSGEILREAYERMCADAERIDVRTYRAW